MEEFKIENRKVEENTENRLCVGEILWLEAQRNKKNELFFLINDKYTGKIILDEANYQGIYRIPIQELLLKIPHGQRLLCMVRRILPGFRVELRWMIEEDPSAEVLRSILKLDYSQTTDELLAGILSRLEEKEKKTINLEGKEVIKTEIPQLKTPKIVGKIDLDAINTKTKPKKKPYNELLKEKEERIHLAKERRETLKQARRESRAKEKELKIENRPKIGEIFWLEIKGINQRNRPIFWVANKYKAKIVIDTTNYPDLDTRKAVKKVLYEATIGQQLLCKVVDNSYAKKYISLRWMIEKDPYAKKFPDLNKSKTLKLHRILQNWLNKLVGK